MSDVNVLYTVTAVVLAGLALWAGVVLFTAEDAPDESPPEPGAGSPGAASGGATAGLPKAVRAPAIADLTPPPSTVEVSVPSERAVAIAGKSAPVVILPVMRHRLDSHSEIRDDGAELLAAARLQLAGAGASSVEAPSPDAVSQPSGPPLSLTTAMGRSEPAHGPTEMSAIVDRHHLIILAEGGGQRVQNELVSAVVVDALAAAFEADAEDVFPADPGLPRRADRLRRAALAADARLRSRTTEAETDLSRVALLAAHFSPDNRSLYVVTAGPDRAYRLRGSELLQLNKPSVVSGSSHGGKATLETLVFDTAPEDVYVFGSDAAFLALGDELRAVLTSDRSIDHVAAHFVDAATRQGRSAGMTVIVVRVEPPRPSVRAPAP